MIAHPVEDQEFTAPQVLVLRVRLARAGELAPGAAQVPAHAYW